MARTLILCPTHDHADTLFASIASVIAQRDQDWEMVVIGDGAPERSAQIVREFSQADPRIRYVGHPKGAHFGEAYRDPVIRGSRAEFVCHLGDDDLWHESHLDTMRAMLEDADWAMQGELVVRPNGNSVWRFSNQGTVGARKEAKRGRMVSGGSNNVAVRREAYLRLADGWSPAPKGRPADKTMWLKYLSRNDIRVACSADTTYLKFTGQRIRADMAPAARLAEMAPLLATVNRPGVVLKLRENASIGFPLLRAFYSEGAAAASTLEAAFAQAGLRMCSGSEATNIAVDGAAMFVPLSRRQARQCEFVWRILRELATGEPLSDSFLRLLEEFTSDLPVCLDRLCRDAPAAALLATDRVEHELGCREIAMRTRLRQLLALGRKAEATNELTRVSAAYPNAAWLRALSAKIVKM